MTNSPKKIVLIGAGNLAHHLAALLVKKGHEIIQVVSRHEESARTLGLKFFTSHTTSLNKINQEADIYLICINDSEIENVASSLHLKGKLVLHTSGSIGIRALKKASGKYGVIYPLQTFTAGAKVKWSRIPLLIEGNTIAVTNEITSFALSLCKQVHTLNSMQRQKLHLAAVFACNFSNHLYTLAEDFLQEEKSNTFDLLKPLILQTAKKIKKISPAEAQTGPAIRNDKNVIEGHLKLLAEHKIHKELYTLFTKSIYASAIKKKKDGEL
jgi:predicted short-subunit dehydrogenase-like oxidoreductase (DUF2520 family)